MKPSSSDRSVLADKKVPMNWKFAAAEQLLDRALGKASQEVKVNRDTNVSVKFETFEDVQRGLQDFGTRHQVISA